MTAPSNANTSGLEVVAWRRHDVLRNGAYFADRKETAKMWFDRGLSPEPLVTAASAQARIAELETLVASIRKAQRDVIRAEIEQEGYSPISDANDRATAAEARADRLADIVKLLDECIWFNPDTQNFEVNHDGSVEKARAALQQEG